MEFPEQLKQTNVNGLNVSTIRVHVGTASYTETRIFTNGVKIPEISQESIEYDVESNWETNHSKAVEFAQSLTAH